MTRVARPHPQARHDERFVSPALRLFEMGYTPTHLAAVIIELQETIHAEGERVALAKYATIAENYPLVDLVVEHSDRIRE